MAFVRRRHRRTGAALPSTSVVSAADPSPEAFKSLGLAYLDALARLEAARMRIAELEGRFDSAIDLGVRGLVDEALEERLSAAGE